MKEVLNVKGVSHYFGGLKALSEINMHIAEHEIVGVIGPNGAGKTTLFNCITGIYKPSVGNVELSGIDVTGWAPYKITKLGFARTFQNIRLFGKLSVLDTVIVGLHTRTAEQLKGIPFWKQKERKIIIEDRAREILRIFDMDDSRYEMAKSLPYGKQRELEIARALACQPKLLMLDEPAAGMNEIETEELMNTVKKLRDMGNAIMLIEHDMRFVMNICDRIYVLNEGTLIAQGTPGEVKDNQIVIEAYLGKDE